MIYFIHVCSLNIAIGAFITSEDGNTVNITDSIISNCYSSTSGAITIYQNELNIRNTQFIANEAGSSAGAMYIARDSFVTIEDCEFLDNSVPDYAGAIYIGDNNDITISNNRFEDNMADVGGAIVMLAGIGTEEENTVNIVAIKIVVATKSLHSSYILAKKYAFKPGAIAAIITAFLK